MQSITFVGENLILGNLGHFFVVVAFISALLSAVFYTKSSVNRSLGRAFFVTHTLSVLGVFTTLFVIIQWNKPLICNGANMAYRRSLIANADIHIGQMKDAM
jgi:hypothetical protein